MEDATHDDICGALVHDLESIGWEVQIEVPLVHKGETCFPDVLARPEDGPWMLFEVKSHHEKTTLGAAITQIRKYHEALGETLADVLVTTFTPSHGQMVLLANAEVEWVKGCVYDYEDTHRAPRFDRTVREFCLEGKSLDFHGKVVPVTPAMCRDQPWRRHANRRK